MRIAVEREGSPVRVTLEGDLTTLAAPAVEAELGPLVSDRDHLVIVDLAGVPRVDSRGLGALVNLTCRSNMNQGRLILARPSPFVAEVVAVTGLDRFFRIQSELDAGG